MSTLTSVTVFKKAEHNFGYNLVTIWLHFGYVDFQNQDRVAECGHMPAHST